MTKFHTLLISVGVSSVIGIVGLVYQPAFAVSAPANGLLVSPPVSNIKISPNQTSAIINETITNITSNTLAVSVSARDFGALNASGSVGFYGSSYKPSKNPHSLSSALQLPTTSLLIGPKQTQDINISLDNLNQLSAGGHYSALIFTPHVAQANAKGSNQLSLQPSVASLIFVTTASGGYQSVKLSGWTIPMIGFRLPNNISLTLANTGNTQLVPRGVISINDPKSKVVSQTILNTDSGLVLPGTSSLFSVSLPTTKDIFRTSGIYRVKLTYFVDGSTTTQTATKSFLYINPIVVVYLGGGLLILWLLREISKKSKYKTKSKPKKKRRSKKKKPIKINVKEAE